MEGSSDSEGALTEEEVEPQIDHAVMEGSSESEHEMTEEDMALLRAGRVRRQESEQQGREIATDPRLSFGEKLDRLKELRHWYLNDGDTTIVDLYLAGSLSIDAAAEKLAAPVEHLYTTADEGKAYFDAEQTARNQRQYHSPERALELWGPELDFPEPPRLPEGSLHPSCECKLWDLWYGIWHAAKKIEWDEPGQARLIELMKALKSRPDPPLPEPMTIPLKGNWIWECGGLWTQMLLLGPAVRESWDDQSPGSWGRWTDVDVRAFVNVNALLAKATIAEVRDFSFYGFRIMQDLLERAVTGQASNSDLHFCLQTESDIMLASVWMRFAGQYLWDRRVEDGSGYGEITLNIRGEDLPWMNGQTDEVSSARWRFWISRLREISDDERLSKKSQNRCLEVARIMQEIVETTSRGGEEIRTAQH